MEEAVRKLATVRTVQNLIPIEGADLIELAVIDGWQVVVKRANLKSVKMLSTLRLTHGFLTGLHHS